MLSRAMSSCSEPIVFRKQMLSHYLTKLFTSKLNNALIQYLDWVAIVRCREMFSIPVDSNFTLWMGLVLIAPG
jgi:hypothetical protein